MASLSTTPPPSCGATRKYAGTFEQPLKTLDRNDLKKLSENFDAIRTGRIIVK